jgi:hypothetical protein
MRDTWRRRIFLFICLNNFTHFGLWYIILFDNKNQISEWLTILFNCTTLFIVAYCTPIYIQHYPLGVISVVQRRSQVQTRLRVVSDSVDIVMFDLFIIDRYLIFVVKKYTIAHSLKIWYILFPQTNSMWCTSSICTELFLWGKYIQLVFNQSESLVAKNIAATD